MPDVLPAAWLPALVEGPLPVPIHSELRPVRWDYGARLYALENAAMGGPTASPVFGPISMKKFGNPGMVVPR